MLSMFMAPAKAAAEAAPKAGEAAMGAAEAAQPHVPPVDAAHSWAMPIDASTFAESTDNLYFFIVALDVLFFVLVIAAMLYFMVKYRKRSDNDKTSSITHNGKIEFLWSAVPAVLLIVIFVWSEIDFVKQATPPADALSVRVTGQTWLWNVDYPDFDGAHLDSSDPKRPTLLVPKGRPVRLTLTSKDVIHSFYIPAFRVKRDAVPGRYTNMWFEATKVGEFNIFCAEYCGEQHSMMTGTVRVVEADEFEPLLKEMTKLERGVDSSGAAEPLAAYGERVYKRRGCFSCHNVDGKPGGIGPSWKGLWDKEESLVGGATVKVDEDYIRRSILEPNAQVVQGYGAVMPSGQGLLNEEQIDALIQYIKTLK